MKIFWKNREEMRMAKRRNPNLKKYIIDQGKDANKRWAADFNKNLDNNRINI